MVGIRTPMNRDPWGANSRRVHSLRSLALRRR